MASAAPQGEHPKRVIPSWVQQVAVPFVVAVAASAFTAGIYVQQIQGRIDTAADKAEQALAAVDATKRTAAGIKQSHTIRINQLRDHIDERLDRLDQFAASAKETMKWLRAQQEQDSLRAREEWRDWIQRERQR